MEQLCKDIRKVYETETFRKALKQNARSKPVLFLPQTGKSVAYKSMSAMTRVTGLRKSKLIGNKKIKMMGDIKRSSSAMNKAGLKGTIVSADDTMFTAK